MKNNMLLAALLCLGSQAGMVSAADAQTAPQRWYKGNTHAHSSNSRGGDTAPDALARWYREHGYQFVFITDHDEYLTDVAPINALLGRRDWFLVLPGQENGQRINRKDGSRGEVHINALFSNEVIISTRGGTTIEGTIAPVLAQGAIAQVNHPNYLWSMTPADFDNVPDGTLLEVWNGGGGINNLGGDDGKGDVRPSAEGYWDYLLSRGKIIWATGADDSHVFKGEAATDPDDFGPGRAWIMVRAPELTPAALKTAIQKGDFYASTGVTLTDIVVDANGVEVTIAPTKANPRYLTRFIGQDGKVLSEVAGLKPSYRFTGSETYVRASIIDSNGKRAWGQPVFRDNRTQRNSFGATR
jgi:hypothetical protein